MNVSKKAPVKKNQHIDLYIEDLTHEGNGVGKVNGYPIFIPYALPGEEAEVRIVKANKNFGFGKLIETKKISEHRVTPPCNVYFKCGGCQLQHMDYETQLMMKQNQVKNVMKKIAHLPHVPVHETIGMPGEPWFYRNKMQIPVGENDGKLITGFYRERSHDIIPDMERCWIQNEPGDTLVKEVRDIADALGISAYNEVAHQGDLRHIFVRTAYTTGEMMIVLVTKREKVPQLDQLIEQITAQNDKVISVIQNVHPEKKNVILGKKFITHFGKDYLEDKLGDLTFKISPQAFYQVNPEQTEVLYEKALEYAAVDSNDIVIDAYCGIGSISLFLAQKAKKVYGVEIVPQAITDAKENAKINHLDNTEFVVGQAEKVMPWWYAQGLRPDVIVVDPPRKGCDEALLEAMLGMKPNRIVYVSCNPSTLARDLRILEDGGYQTQEIQPVDMFPQTNHVELVALMSRVEE